MELSPILSTLIVATISAVVGYIISLWRTRIRPWITIEGFVFTQDLSDQVKLPPDFLDATKGCWWGQVSTTEASLEEFMYIFEAAEEWLEDSKRSQQVATTVIQRLNTSRSDAETISALREFFDNEGLRRGIYLAVDWAELIVPDYNKDRPQQIPFYQDDDVQDGVLMFDFPEAIYTLGANLKTRPPLREKLSAFAELVSRLESEKVAEVINTTARQVREQRDKAQIILDEGRPVEQQYSRMRCNFSITNFGATPFVIFPGETVMIVRGKGFDKIELPCTLLEFNDDEGWHTSARVILSQVGTTHDLACATKAQHEIKRGDMLRGIFQQGDGRAVVNLQVMSRDLPWKRGVQSIEIPFKKMDSS